MVRVALKIATNVEYNRSRHTQQTPTTAQTLPVPIVGYTLLAAVI